jgi:hypothetical protein
MTERIAITFSFLHAWWAVHYHSSSPMPELASDEALERICLGRQRFLFEKFGEYGLGEAFPRPENQPLNVIMKWCVDFIPYLLGIELTCIEAGFWQARPISAQEAKKLKPADISGLPFAEWIYARKQKLIERYGSAKIGQLVEGSVNAACRIRGEDFYCDLLLDRGLAEHLLSVVTETVIHTYQFFAREFNLEEIFLANCSNQHIGADLYAQNCLKNDIRTTQALEGLFQEDRFCYLHHCDASADGLLEHYGKIPHIRKMDGSYKTDISKAKTLLPGALFTAFVNPGEVLSMGPDDIAARLAPPTAAGADELLFANIDPAVSPEKIKGIMSELQKKTQELGKEAVFSVVPITEDEYEWAFPAYQGCRVNRVADDWRLLIP